MQDSDGFCIFVSEGGRPAVEGSLQKRDYAIVEVGCPERQEIRKRRKDSVYIGLTQSLTFRLAFEDYF